MVVHEKKKIDSRMVREGDAGHVGPKEDVRLEWRHMWKDVKEGWSDLSGAIYKVRFSS